MSNETLPSDPRADSDIVRDLAKAVQEMKYLWQSPCTVAEFNAAVRELVYQAESTGVLVERLRRIAAHVPAREYIKAKESAGYGVQVKTL